MSQGALFYEYIITHSCSQANCAKAFNVPQSWVSKAVSAYTQSVGLPVPDKRKTKKVMK